MGMSSSRLWPALLAALFATACEDTPSTAPDAAPADVADASDATPADVAAKDATPADVANDSPSDASAADVTADVPTVDVTVDVPATDVAVDTPDAAGLCASFPANAAPVIMDTFTTAPMPSLASLTGGVVSAGAYYQTQHIYHGVASGTVHSWQATTVFSPGATVAAVNISRDGAVFQQLAERVSYAGGAMSVSIACPSVLAGTTLGFGYTYAAGSLRVYSYIDNTESVFTLQ